MLKAGILLPRSAMYPALGLQLLTGFKENLKLEGIHEEIELFTDNIGFGINEPEIYNKAEKMILGQDVDMIILCADIIITEMLQPLFTATNKILLVVNFGANFPDSWQPASTTIVHSLNFCMHASLTGKLAAKETNKQAANVVSYYDGGYRQCFSMLNGHQSNGGTARFNHVTSLKAEDFTLAPLIGFLEEHTDVKTLLCLFAGKQAQHFYREIKPVQAKLDLVLYGSPMMFIEELEKTGIRGFVPWHVSLNNEANNSFREAIHSSPGNTANYFYLLGWEAAVIVHEIIEMKNDGKSDAPGIIQKLTGIELESPRGWIKFDVATHHSYGPSYLAICRDNDVVIRTEAEDVDAAWKTFTSESNLQGERSGWRNTYLCI
jgi:branched-chain amino acid transport system substrate-binding protein